MHSEKWLEAIRKANLNPEIRKKRSECAKRRWKLYGKNGWNIVEGEQHYHYNPSKFKMKRNGLDFTKSQRKRLTKDKCEWCNSTEKLQLDHIIAVINNGTNDDSNAQTLCQKCNNEIKRLADIREYQQRGEFGETPIRDNPEPSWVRKSLEGLTTRGRVYRKKGTKYLRIEVACTKCGEKTLKQPNQLRRAKKGIFCSEKCRINYLNSTPREIDKKTGKFLPTTVIPPRAPCPKGMI